MKAQKTKEEYLLTDKDPVNGKDNKIILSVDLKHNGYDILKIRVSENSDIVQQAALFAQDILASTPVSLPKKVKKPTIIK